MKRLFGFVLAVSLLMSGCVGGTTSDQPASSHKSITATDLLEQLLAAVPEGSEYPRLLSDGELESCLIIYGIDRTLVQDCAVAWLGGMRVFELAVIDLTVPSYAAEDALLTYLKQRQGDFTGYAPAQAEIAANGKLFALNGSYRLVLALTEDTEIVRRTLSIAGYKVDEVFSAREWDDQATTSAAPDITTVTTPSQEEASEPEATFKLPHGWHPYTDPHTDDMTIYDSSAIVTAWKTGDSDALSKRDRQVYEKCTDVLGQIITEAMSDHEKEWAVYQWLTRNVNYDWRHQDRFQSTPRISYQPYGALIEGKAVCLGFATAFQLLMDLLDMECITVVGAAFQSSESHAWNMVRLGGEWYCVDATWDMGVSSQYWRYFNVTSEYMAKSDHQWDYENTPMATAANHGERK